MTEPYVILVDEQDNETGIMEKLEAHRSPNLHRAFSVFLFNHKNEILLQQRAIAKYHSGGLWTNTCCSHPYPGETVKNAAIRRLQEEMSITATIEKAFDFTYQANFDNGLIEYEFDHVFIGRYEGPVSLNEEEVASCIYKPIAEIKKEIENNPGKYTEWFKIALPKLEAWMLQNSY